MNLVNPARLKFVGRIAFSVALILWLASRLDWAGLIRHFADVDWRWLSVVVLCSPLCLVLLTARWLIFLRARQLKPSPGGLLRLLWAGQFFNTFLPGAVGGDVFKAVAVGRLLPGAQVEAGATVVVDRFCAFLTLALLALVGASLQHKLLQAVFAAGIVLPRGALLAAAGLGVGALALVGGIGRSAWFRQRRETWRQNARLAGWAVLAGLRDWPTFAWAAILSLVIHLANFTVFFAVARMLRLDIGFGQVLLIMPVVLIIAMLPVTINGHGLREIVLVTYFHWQGIGGPGVGPAEAAVAVSLLYVTNDLLWNLPGGIGLALGKRAETPVCPPLPHHGA